jgi:predicted nucleic acid-binding Zn ribbon protein
VCGKLLNSTKNKMKKKDYMEMEKEYKRGTKMLIIMFIIIVIGALVINQYSGI